MYLLAKQGAAAALDDIQVGVHLRHRRREGGGEGGVIKAGSGEGMAQVVSPAQLHSQCRG